MILGWAERRSVVDAVREEIVEVESWNFWGGTLGRMEIYLRYCDIFEIA